MFVSKFIILFVVLLKKEKKKQQMDDVITGPVERETRKLLEEVGLGIGFEADERGTKLINLVGIMVNFEIYRCIKSGIQLPTLNQEEEAKDEERLRLVRTSLEQVSTELGIAPYEVSDLISKLASDEELIGQIMAKNYDMLESLVGSQAFHEMTNGQVENPDTWGDSLPDYASLEGTYFDALKEVFLLNLKVVRAGSDGSESTPDLEGGLVGIGKKYDLPADSLDKLSRRGTEFLRAAFANYLEMDFQPVREGLDGKGSSSGRQSKPIQ